MLTAPSHVPGTANCDFAIFPPRWMVAEHTFRPPWFHRNLMNEFMGLVFGAYDAKAEGFVPGGASLHNCMAGHGPDAETFESAATAELKPQYLANTLAFMFETQLVVRPTEFAMNTRILQHEYFECWQGLKKHFNAELKGQVQEEMTAIEAVLGGLIDYAGLYPPASLDMRAAVRNYLEYRDGPHAFALGRFIVDIARTDELREAAGSALTAICRSA